MPRERSSRRRLLTLFLLLLVPAFSRQSLVAILSTHPSLDARLAQLRRLEAEGLAR